MAVEAARSHTVRVSAKTHQHLRELSESTGEPITTILTKAVGRYRREERRRAANQLYAEYLSDAAAREEFDAEQAELDGTLLDGLEEDPW